MPSSPTPAPLEAPGGWSPPQEFHEYRLVRPLGRGRSGSVFLAEDTLLERPVAVKFVPVKGGDALMRLLNEARAAARIQHPNVVTLYRVGQLDDYAYLVTEFTRGTSLDRVQRPVSPEQAQRYAVDLARGLAAAHRAGVLHRDLKPGNAVLAEDGAVKLLDFGVAKLVDPKRASSERPRSEAHGPELLIPSLGALRADLVGTPYYMSPEAWRGEEHTLRSDLYSLGALLYDLCTGNPPFRHVPLSALPQVLREEPAVPLAQRAPGLHPAFAAAVDRCLRADPLERFASAEALLDALESAAPTAREKVPEGNPYRGLRPFEPEHRALFFGRRRDLSLLRERLRAEPFVLLTGDSGVGKSSLAAAGLLPEIAEGALGDNRRWKAVRLVPGSRPLTALATALTPFLGFGPDDSAVEAVLRGDPDALARRIRAAIGTDRGLVVYVDQLEELVTLAEPAEAARTAIALASIAQGVPGVRLLASARSDFLTRLAALPQLGAPLARAIHLVRPLDPEDLREAVVGPARIKGVRFESEALVDELVRSAASPGGLPLLQFALAELWEARDASQEVIAAAALQKLGGVSGALARHADAVIDALLPEQRPAARQLLLRLVTEDGTRARRSADELTGGDARYKAALEALVRSRLLVAREGELGTAYEVAHEALLSGWGRLAAWLAEEADTRSVRRRLEAAALEWERLAQRPEALWGPQALAEARVLPETELDARQQLFLEASRRSVRRGHRARRTLAAVTVGLVVFAAGSVRAKVLIDRHRQIAAELVRADEAEARAREIVAREEAARHRAFDAFDHGQPEDGERAWAEALGERARADDALARESEALERAAAVDPDRNDLRARLAAHLLQRELRAERDGRDSLARLLGQRLAVVDPDGAATAALRAPARLVVHAGAAAVKLWKYREDESGRLRPEALPEVRGERPLSLEPGSYLLERTGEPPTRLPLLLDRGEQLEVQLPAAPPAPEGFAFVPAGRFLWGSGAEESVRQFFNTVPIHEVQTGAYFIALRETTWREYLRYLDALPDDERVRRTPRAGSSDLHGTLELTREDGRWKLAMQPSTVRLSAFAGETMHYPGRSRRADVDWLSLPVGGISFDDAQAYARWLDRTGRVPHARLCTELEWERAARGADSREYPHGRTLSADDADFDASYGKDPLAFGPDPVGSHPASRSPYGVDDLVGNVWEWATSVLAPGRPVARGGAYYYSAGSCRSANRETPEPSFRELTVGVRICADPPAAVH